MKSYAPALLSIAFALVAPVAAQTVPSPPVDPTAHAPSTKAPANPPTSQEPETKPPEEQPRAVSPNSSSSPGQARVFLGAIVNHRHAYVLKSATTEYRLDDQQEAKKYAGRDVKVTGMLEGKGKSQTILVHKIEVSPSL
jgi:hypothetical protein